MATVNVSIMKTFTIEELNKIREACDFINDGDPITLEVIMKVESILKLIKYKQNTIIFG